MQRSWKKSLLSLVLILGFTTGVYAVGTPVTSNPYLPHVFVEGYAGSGVVGTGDVLQPIWLKQDRNFFFYGQGNYGYADQDWAKNPWSGSAGFGYRQIGNAAVYGLFVLGDYNHTLTNHNVWQVSPGLEILGRSWEFRANGYVPVGDKDWRTEGWADEFGNYDYVSFTGHDMYDAWFIYHEEVGGGADAEIGRTLFKVKNTLIKGYVNGYYYHMVHNKSLRGGGASIEVEPNTYLKFTAKGSYDNYAHTQVAVGVQISLYDLFSSDSKVINDQDLQRKLFEPVQRDFANIASASDIRTAGSPGDRTPNGGGSPEVLTWYDHNAPERTNVWFFNGAGVTLSSGVGVEQDITDGTYEHPFTGSEFDQGNVNNIAAYTAANGYGQAYLYFNPATYNAYTATVSGMVGNAYTPINIPSLLSLWGRMGDNKGYQMPATGNNRSLFVGAFQLNSMTSVNNIRLQNYLPDPTASGVFQIGITMNNAQDVSINDSEIGVDGPNGSYPTGVTMENNSDLTISNSNIYGYVAPVPTPAGPNTGDAVGLEVVNGGNVTATKDSIIKGHSVDGLGIGLYVAPYDSNGNGILDAASVGNLSGDGTATYEGNSDNSNGYGLYAFVPGYYASISAISIGDISDLKFMGKTTGLYTFNDGYLNPSTHATNSVTTTIGNISDSNFTGGTFGLYAYNDGRRAGYNSSGTASVTTTIGNISDSNFTGSSFGLYAYNAGTTKSSSTNTVTIGDISNSIFTGIYGLSAKGTGTANSTNLGTITGSTFSSSSKGLDLSGGTVTVDSISYTTGQALYDALVGSNTFTGPLSGGAVCVNGSCSSP